MVQLKVSSLLLVAAVAGVVFGSDEPQDDSLSLRELVQFELDSRGLDLEDMVGREELLQEIMERSLFYSQAPQITTHVVPAHRPYAPGILGFLKDVGEFVKRCAKQYWRGIENEVEILDFRHRRHRFDSGHQEAGGEDANLQARGDPSDLAPRMSWFGQALLIYRDMQNPPNQLVKRSSPDNELTLFYRELLEDLLEDRGYFDDYLDELD